MLHSKPVFFWCRVAMSINHECVRVGEAEGRQESQELKIISCNLK
jgi:hypothetical protein